MGSAASALEKATVEEVQKVHAELSPEDQEKLKQAMAQLQKASLVSGTATTVETKPAPKRSMLEMLTRGCSNAENSDSMKPMLLDMFFRIDRDENGKVKVSELGGCADMILKMVQDVDDSIETKEDLMKSFDSNRDGLLSQSEWKDVCESAVKGVQVKMCKKMLAKGNAHEWPEEEKGEWEKLKPKLEAMAA
eukprot:Skav234422  [mRNA]  locus=scaffold1656:27099:27674:- [translate_table: standard]